MSDRAEQARVEAERRYPESWDHYNDEPVDDWGYSECQREAFCAGVVWADEHQTVTPQALVVAYEEGMRDAHEMFRVDP